MRWSEPPLRNFATGLAGVMQRANLVSEGRGPPSLWRHSLGLATHR
jgi:hypothetical protein